jgi:hypothetical protein
LGQGLREQPDDTDNHPGDDQAHRISAAQLPQHHRNGQYPEQPDGSNLHQQVPVLADAGRQMDLHPPIHPEYGSQQQRPEQPRRQQHEDPKELEDVSDQRQATCLAWHLLARFIQAPHENDRHQHIRGWTS